jgi:hypothetical protein
MQFTSDTSCLSGCSKQYNACLLALPPGTSHCSPVSWQVCWASQRMQHASSPLVRSCSCTTHSAGSRQPCSAWPARSKYVHGCEREPGVCSAARAWAMDWNNGRAAAAASWLNLLDLRAPCSQCCLTGNLLLMCLLLQIDQRAASALAVRQPRVLLIPHDQLKPRLDDIQEMLKVEGGVEGGSEQQGEWPCCSACGLMPV